MDYGLKGKRAVVLGASRGLGAASALALSAEGAEVIAVSRSGTLPNGAPPTMTSYQLDLVDEGAITAFATELKRQSIDILINNCGGPKAGHARGQSRADWQAAFQSMALPVFVLTNAVLDHMTTQLWGRIVTIGSSGIEVPIPALALSNGIRASIAGWSKTLSAEVAAQGVTVNMVLPGRISTDRVAELDAAKATRTGQTIDEIAAISRAAIPAGRYGRPEEFAAAVAFLASAQASYITGSMLRVDGGMIGSL